MYSGLNTIPMQIQVMILLYTDNTVDILLLVSVSFFGNNVIWVNYSVIKWIHLLSHISIHTLEDLMSKTEFNNLENKRHKRKQTNN